MPKSVAIIQSNYIPWKGYFDMIGMVDEFVLLDDVQYTRRDWRNRNQIKTANGLQWLTIPVDVKGRFECKINEVMVADPTWARDHWNKISQAYSKASFFVDYRSQMEECYLGYSELYLSKINYRFLVLINSILGIKTPIRWSEEFSMSAEKSQRLLDICKQIGASAYLSGPAAKDYLKADLFRKEGIEVKWMEYSGYEEYKQLHGSFEHSVSVLDLIFNEGPNGKQFLKSLKNT
jgi:WbqC-like protein family